MILVPSHSPALLAVALLLACGSGGKEPARAAATAAPSPTPMPPANIMAGKSLYSQGREELIIRDFFQDRRDGVFLDVGCASPIANSNTYYLEKHLGWRGIAVDALPDYAAAWQRKRPGSRFFNYLIADHIDPHASFYRAEFRGISSSEKDIKGPGGEPVKTEEIHVPMTTLTKLLDDSGVSKIDFMSMDIEGAEPPALAGFDIDRFKPELACIESKPANRDKIIQYFTTHGYRRLERYLEYDKTNYYFTPKR
jgi:FkbM family methyltransferase